MAINKIIITPTEKEIHDANVRLLKQQIKKETAKLKKEFSEKWLK